ncbi:MAG TPA: RHS repeat-associated core domain-containing protein, partial [Mycobacterium sp.]|nr:RHS repeat-associated core domain-containing protein [Mycobacterium sp.]
MRDRGTDLVYDGYDQLREVRPGPGGAPSLVNLPLDDLGNLGGSSVTTQDVNGAGHVVGYGTIAGNAVTHGFTATSPGPLTDVSVRAAVPGSLFATAINDSDTVTGAFDPQNQTGNHVFRYALTGATPFEDLGLGSAYDINEQKQVVGDRPVGTASHAYRYTDGVGFRDLGTLPGGTNSFAFGVDRFGTVVGASQVAGTPSTGFERLGHAYVFTDALGGMLDLNSLVSPASGWTLIAAHRISGDFVAGYGKKNSLQRAFRIRISNGAVDDVTGSWATGSVANATNSYGDVVGTLLDSGGGVQAAFVYSDQFGLKNLNDLVAPASNWTLLAATGVNDVGDVVGWGTHNGAAAAFRMRVPLHNTTSGGPSTAVVHTYGFDGLRTSTSTDVTTATPKSQYWFTQDYTEHDGQRDHYVRMGNRLIARVTMQPAGGVGAGTLSAAKQGAGQDRNPPQPALALALLLAAALLAAFGVMARRRRWVPAVAGLASLILGAGSCRSFGSGNGALAWTAASNLTVYFHHGISPGPSLTTDATGALSEERRYEPFGQPLDAFRPGTGVVAVDFRRDPQNILGKLSDPNTGWSYHGARWMASQTARWLTPDPAIKGPDPKHLLEPWDLNPYGYVRQNPTKYWDPDGRAIKESQTTGTTYAFVSGWIDVTADLDNLGTHDLRRRVERAGGWDHFSAYNAGRAAGILTGAVRAMLHRNPPKEAALHPAQNDYRGRFQESLREQGKK